MKTSKNRGPTIHRLPQIFLDVKKKSRFKKSLFRLKMITLGLIHYN